MTDRDDVVAALLRELEADNYITQSQLDDYRVALWREYLRSQGRDFSHVFSTLEVTIRGAPGDDRDSLAFLCRSVLAEFELQPEITFEAPVKDQDPELVIGDTSVASGRPSRRTLKNAVRRRLSDW
jgi:hypothetical protein